MAAALLPAAVGPAMQSGSAAGERIDGQQPARLALCSRRTAMNMTLAIGPLVALIAGILILIVPRLLNFIVAIYLIVIGLLGLFGGSLNLH
jgi:hypothetical protein